MGLLGKKTRRLITKEISRNRLFSGTPRGNYWIVDTDYDSYSLVWSCTDLFVVNFDIAWILSRKRTLDDSTVTMLKQKLAGFGINVDGFRVTDQSNCPQ